jgi:hypothetical protein
MWKAPLDHAANFDDAFLGTDFVTGEIVTYQLAVPTPEEVARMLEHTFRIAK